MNADEDATGYYQTARSKRRVSHVRRTAEDLLFRTREVGSQFSQCFE